MSGRDVLKNCCRCRWAYGACVPPKVIAIVEEQFLSCLNISCCVDSDPLEIGGRACVEPVSGSKSDIDCFASSFAVIDKPSFKVMVSLGI